MAWTLDILENPEDIRFPIKGMETSANGLKRGPYFFSVDDVVAALKQVAPSVNSFVPMELPPRNTVYITHSNDLTQYKVIMEIPKAIQTIRYENGGVKRLEFIGFPRLLCSVSVKKVTEGWRVDDSKLFAVEEQAKIDYHTQLFHFPFPNVYKNQTVGDICWGGNSLPIYKEIRDLEKVFHLFLQAPFNEDLQTFVFSNHQKSFLSYLEKVTNDETPLPFNDEDLIPCKMTFGDLLENF